MCALLHDIGDILVPDNHSEVIEAILRPYISERNHGVLKHHGLFQGYYYYFHHSRRECNTRDRFLDHPHYQTCVGFCQYRDQESFDPDYETLPVEHFMPMVERMLTDPKS